MRANKKKGIKSKKELREEVNLVSERLVPKVIFSQVQKEASEKLKAISIKHGFVSGKWYANLLPTRSRMLEISIDPTT